MQNKVVYKLCDNRFIFFLFNKSLTLLLTSERQNNIPKYPTPAKAPHIISIIRSLSPCISLNNKLVRAVSIKDGKPTFSMVL